MSFGSRQGRFRSIRPHNSGKPRTERGSSLSRPWQAFYAKTADIATITAVPLGLAFLTWLRIDILFSLLDRLNRMVTDSAAQPVHRGAQARAPA
jgi:hypothetical protein